MKKFIVVGTVKANTYTKQKLVYGCSAEVQSVIKAADFVIGFGDI